jgi:hypothetical protein
MAPFKSVLDQKDATAIRAFLINGPTRTRQQATITEDYRMSDSFPQNSRHPRERGIHFDL